MRRWLLCVGLVLVPACSGNESTDPPTTEIDGSSTSDSTTSVDTGGSTDDATVVDTGAPPPGDAPPPPPPGNMHFVVYGDSRSNVAPHQQVVDAFAKRDPQFVLATGDLWDGYGPDQWKTIITKNKNIGALLEKNLFLVSRGNHETVAEVKAFKPTLLRGDAELYSFTQGNGFFVSLGMDPASQATYLEGQLSSPAAKAAAWRFVYSHYPIYSAGPHGGDGIAAIEALCDKYGVAVYFTGHDHLYERSQQMKAQKVVDTGNALTASKGTVYVVTGGGGAPLYAVGKIASTHFTKSTLHFVDVEATDTQLNIQAFTTDGKVLDTFTIKK